LLTFCDPSRLDITRQRVADQWVYTDATGHIIRDRIEIDRLNAIALPPAYTDAAFNSDPDGHLQAIGTDARGRRQYRYHADYRAAQDNRKFALCADFGRALPRLRRAVETALLAPPTSEDAVLAAMVRLLDTAYLRIGNAAYWRDNKSVGLTTLRNRHARVAGNKLLLHYRGKAGVERSVRLSDRSLVRIVRRCQDLPGQSLFQYRGSDGAVHAIGSNEVNAFLRMHLGDDFTAKHFRTWHASVIAFGARRSGQPVKDMLETVASALGNTPAIARKSYIHPGLTQADPQALAARPLPRATRYLTRDERGFALWLDEQDSPGHAEQQ
jgi:DNA topoisomerase I